MGGHKKINISPIPAQRLKEQIKSCGITQKELASKAGCTEQQLSRIINGRCELVNDTARRFADYLHCRKEWLLGEDDYQSDDEYTIHATLKQIDEIISERSEASRQLFMGEYTKRLLNGMGYNTSICEDGETASIKYQSADGSGLTETIVPVDDLKIFAEQLFDYAEYLIQWKLLKGGVNHGKHNT